VAVRRTKAEKEQAAMSATVNMSGKGEDPAVQALLSDKFVHGTNTEAAEIAIALRKLISGQGELLEAQKRQDEQLRLVRQRMHEMDLTAEKWEKDKQAFLQEVFDRADRIRPNNTDSVIANGAQQMSDAITMAKAKLHTDNLQFKQRLNTMPKETVVSPGELIQVMENGRPVTKLYPEVIRIRTFQWVLQPGVPTEVPSIVADALRDRRRSQDETRERESALMSDSEHGVLERKWAEINKKYNSPTGV